MVQLNICSFEHFFHCRLPHYVYHRSSFILLRDIQAVQYSASKNDVAVSIPVHVSSYLVEELQCQRVYDASSLLLNIAILFYHLLSPARCESSHSFTCLPILVRIFNMVISGGCRMRVFITLITYKVQFVFMCLYSIGFFFPCEIPIHAFCQFIVWVICLL